MDKDAERQAKSMDKLGKEDSGGSKVVMRSGADTKKLDAVIAATDAAEQRAAEEVASREAKLRAIKVSREDVEFLSREFELSAGVAERELRLHGGEFQAALETLLGVQK